MAEKEILEQVFRGGLITRFGTDKRSKVDASLLPFFDQLMKIRNDGQLLAVTRVNSWSESERRAFENRYKFENSEGAEFIYQWGFLKGIATGYLKRVNDDK